MPAVKKNTPYKEFLEGWEKRQTHTHVQFDKERAGDLGLHVAISPDRGIALLQHQTCCQNHLLQAQHQYWRHEAGSPLITVRQNQKASIGTRIRLLCEKTGEKTKR